MKRTITKSTITAHLQTKENDIQSMKQEIFQLKDLEYDLFKLNDEIASIEAKYGMVLEEKDRNEVMLKSKLAINKTNLQGLQTDVETIKVQIDHTSLDVANLSRDNLTLLKNTENKENQITNLTIAVKELERTNEAKIVQLQELEEMLIKVKEHKSKISEQYEKLSRKLTANKENSKDLDKEIKNMIVVEKSMRNTLQNLRQDGDSLATEMKARETLLKQTSEQYQTLSEQTAQADELNKKLNKECENLESVISEMTRALEHSQKVVKEKENKLKELQEVIVKSDIELNKSVLKKENLLKEHSDLATTNKTLNQQIDDCLLKILQFESVNKVLQKQVENYINCDQEARIILDRKQKMSELLQTVSTKLSRTESAIAHLM